MNTAVPCPPGTTDCDPDLRLATAVYFDLRNAKKLRNFVAAEITASGYFKFYVENLPKTVPHSGCPGRWLFQVAWEHFVAAGVSILGVRGEWVFGDNLAEVNALTARGLPLEEAAKQTWTGLRASDKGFTTVTILDTDGSPGNYASVDVVFLP